MSGKIKELSIDLVRVMQNFVTGEGNKNRN